MPRAVTNSCAVPAEVLTKAGNWRIAFCDTIIFMIQIVLIAVVAILAVLLRLAHREAHKITPHHPNKLALPVRSLARRRENVGMLFDIRGGRY